MASLNMIPSLLLGWLMLIVIPSKSDSLSSYEVIFEWKEIDYKWPNSETRERFLETHEFIPENNIITGLKLFEDRMFISVPRSRPGVPSTLNMVKMSNVSTAPSSPLLVPYPSWEMQQLGNCNAFQHVQSMEIDEFGRMWIIDVGRVNIATSDPMANCPPKLFIIDLEKDEMLWQYEFPPEVVSPTSNFLNDMVIGCKDRDRCWAYISDATDAKLVVYNLENNKSWFVHHKTMIADPMATDITILGMSYTFNLGIDGIALSPKDSLHDRVYYTPISGFGSYSIPTSILQLADNGVTLKDSDLTIHTSTRSSHTGGLAMDSQGQLFFGLLQNNSVAYVNTNQPRGFDNEILLVENDVDLQWPDTFGFDDKGYLYMITNRMHQYSKNSLDFTEVNFRVVRVFIGSKSYLYPHRTRSIVKVHIR